MNILSKYKSLPTQVKATIWFVACQAIQSGCRFLAMPFLVRLLTTEQYGIYSVFLSWLQIITLFATLNLHCGVYNNAMYKFPDRRSSYTSASQSLSVVCTFLCFGIYLIFRYALWHKTSVCCSYFCSAIVYREFHALVRSATI